MDESVLKNYPLLFRYFSHKPILQVLLLLTVSFMVSGAVVFNPYGPVAFLALPAILLVTLVIFKHPQVGLYLVILAIPFDSHFLSLGPVNLSASNALIVTTLLAWLLAHLFSKSHMVKDINYLLIAWMMLTALMSTFVAIDPDIHIRKIVTLIGCGLIYFLTVNLIKDTKTLNKVLLFLGLAIFMTVAIAIIQSVGYHFWGLTLRVGRMWEFAGPGIPLLLPRVTSVWVDPNAYGFFLLTGLPALFYFALRSKTNKISYIVLAAFVLFGLFLSYSRGAWVGLAASLVVIVLILLSHRSNKKSWPVIFTGFTSVALVVGVVLFDLIRIPVDFIIGLNPEAAAHRIELWVSAINTFLANPVLGVGFGGFLAQYDWDIHNSILEPLVAMGFLGSLPFFILITRILKLGAGNLREDIGVALVVCFIGLVVASFFISGFFLKNLWFLMGLIVATAKIEKRNGYSKT